MIMDQSNDENQKLVAVPKKYSNKYLFYLGQLLMKRTLKLLLSVSLLSLFLLCYSSSSGFCLFPYSFTEFNVYFSTLLFSIFTRALERKYMFLVCNGILAFLAKTNTSKSNDNSCTCSFSCSTTSINNHKSHDESLDQDAIAYAAGEDEGESPTIQEEDDDDRDGQQEELKNGTLLQAEEMPQAFSAEEKGEGSESLIKQREEEMDTPELETNHVNDYLATTSTDELNKKFEEFIRKMKEEIRIEAQQQPIAV
ncbi:hypothetical protein L3X38_020864 [Prunus dulcis]|uniref:Uncharacterized protein n=1 Tax=Prunus dulcis TaxID=3755 RepID=A0AAD4VT59_PRUDU|nr:hypothetical protein L3X38_020864 [Prunus dulcis]